MPKGTRNTRNPVEKLLLQVSQLDNTVNAVLESADKPDFAKSISALKLKIEENKSSQSKLNKEAREVSKLLQTYPGLSRQVLSSLKSKIAEYKTLGVIDKYKTEPEPQIRAKRVVKSAS